MLPSFVDFTMRTRLVAGPGLVRELATELAGYERVLVISDAQLVKLGLVREVTEPLEAAGVDVVGVFSDVPPNSEVEVVMAGAGFARARQYDALVAVGGGSVIDTAKAINMVVATGQHLLDLQGLGVLDEPLGTLVAIPTTAGTGSEVTSHAVIKDAGTSAKLTFTSPHLAPDLAVIDPVMTRDLPPKLAASTGMDALTHAVEAYLSTNANPFTDALALEATRLIAQNFRRAVRERDEESRYGMLVASSLAGAAFNVALVGCVHAMAHACGGLYDVPHGVANAILLPWGLEFNREVAAERVDELGRAFGVEDGRQFIEAVSSLAAEGGLPTRLSEVGVPREGLEAVAEAAAVDGAVFTNPREAGAEDLLKLLERAF